VERSRNRAALCNGVYDSGVYQRYRHAQSPPHDFEWLEGIAGYLRKGVRTVQRYERQLGLPIRRPAGKPRGSVLATKSELDAWVAASPIGEIFALPGKRISPSSSERDELKKAVMEMRSLCKDMQQLRHGFHQSRAALEGTLHSIYGANSSLDKRRPN